VCRCAEAKGGAVAASASPLVLFLTGPTGVGKTETAQRLAAALLTNRVELAGGGSMPEGLVELRGQDFADERQGLKALQEGVKHAVAQELYRCHGTGVLIFDEAQKAVHSVLDGECCHKWYSAQHTP
jgi:adenylylsulfate kinase-like enzyme